MRISHLLAAVAVMASTSSTLLADWKPAASPLMTEWAAKVDPNAPLPEYPRPQMTREHWTNLNGLWDYAIVPAAQATPPSGYQGQILVPFAIESALSGVGKKVGAESALWYRRTLPTPQAQPGERTLIHFGGIDWQAAVYVNGQLVAEHSGGHTPFSADITTALKSSGDNEIVVRVWDPTDLGSQPRGKQVRNPEGIWYTSVTGIWQTVWTETVPAVAIDHLKLTPSADGNSLIAETTVSGTGDAYDVELIAKDGQTQVATGTGKTGTAIKLDIPNAKKWSPDSPFLYDLTVNLKKDGKTVDTVGSYFGLRTVGIAKDAGGYERMTLNGNPLFFFGPLDQGWWPDGLYTAPTDDALRWDIEFTKRLGFNMARKHIKVEPARWYYWCDKLGLAVWQDQSSGMGEGRHQGIGPGAREDASFTPQEKVQFRRELREMLDTLHNSPSIVCWVPFNEGWGQHDTNDILRWVKEYDPSRLVDGPTGWEDRGYGDMHDAHRYPGPGMFPVQEGRASVLGEFGGLGLPIEGHLWQSNGNWGYRSYNDKAGLQDAYLHLIDRLGPLARRGLAAAVYTQTTDVEIEVNGFVTYDRRVIKFDVDTLAKANKHVIEVANSPARIATVVPTSEQDGQNYQFTFEKPADGWETPDAQLGQGWQTAAGPFGHGGQIRSRIEWRTPEIWVRRTVKLEKAPGDALFLRVAHDDDAEVYINGTLALELPGAETTYAEWPLPEAARKLLKQGDNLIAIHCKDTGGDSFLDFGFGEYVPVH